MQKQATSTSTEILNITGPHPVSENSMGYFEVSEAALKKQATSTPTEILYIAVLVMFPRIQWEHSKCLKQVH